MEDENEEENRDVEMRDRYGKGMVKEKNLN